MTAIPQIANLVIVQGANFDEEFYLVDENDQPINLTGYVARMQVRPDKKSDIVLLEFTLDNGRIVIDEPLKGIIKIRLSPTSTGALSFEKGVYDLEIEAMGGQVYRPVEGSVSLNFQVTR